VAGGRRGRDEMSLDLEYERNYEHARAEGALVFLAAAHTRGDTYRRRALALVRACRKERVLTRWTEATVVMASDFEAATERADKLEELLHKFLDLPNDIRFQMGTTFGSTKRDEAYAEGWNDLRVKIGREMLERFDAALAAAPADSRGAAVDEGV
jgi:hypothetical protein